MDVGGTTTDIAALRGGRPRLNPEGAQVGRWRTMVEAVDVHTVGLGGDSHVRLDGDRRLVIGPQRVVPLSLLASQHPEVLDELQSQATVPPRTTSRPSSCSPAASPPANSTTTNRPCWTAWLAARCHCRSLVRDISLRGHDAAPR